MNIKKYIIGAAVAATILGGVSSLAFAEMNGQIKSNSIQMNSDSNQKNSDSNLRAQQMVVQIGPEGRTLLRGTVKTVGTNSLVVTSWGGDWMINISSVTEFMPSADMAQFKVGDFVGAQGSINQSALWTLDATLVRDWTAKKAEQVNMQTNKQEIKSMMEAQNPRNWQGIASNVDTSANSLTLTVDGVAYTVTLGAGVKIVNQGFLTMPFVNVKNGDTVRVWGPSSGTTITAYILRDILITGKSER